MNKEQRDQLAAELLAEAEHRRGRVVDLLRNAAAALSAPDDQQARQPGQVVWVNPEEFDLCQTKPIYMDEHNELLNGMPRQIAALAERTDHCCLALTPVPSPAAQVQGEKPTQVDECSCPKIGEQWDPVKHGKDCPVHEPGVAQLQGELGDFEAWVRQRCGMPRHVPVNWEAPFTLDTWGAWNARAALSAPPAAGVPDVGASPQTCNGKRCGWCKEGAEPCHYTSPAFEQQPAISDEQAVQILLAGGTLVFASPASKQQQPVVLPKRCTEYVGDRDNMQWARGANFMLAEFLRLNPLLQLAATSQGGDA